MSERTYANDDIEVSWNAELCIHTGICLRSEPRVFDLEASPWVAVDGAGPDEVIAAVAKCPTGALQVRRHGEEEAADVAALPEVPEVRLLKNGPAIVRGRVSIQRGGEKLEVGRIALCRCGDSANKPFCDNTHRHNGFDTDGESVAAAARTRTPVEDRESPADVD